MNRADVESFFKTLILGDFEENQNSSAQLIGGLIAMIPVLGQVMAARDITGTLFNIGTKGGFKNATSVELVNLGFAAFGAVPEVGPVFKLVFKPMWKERQLAKGVVSSGLHAIETMLGMAKGGAIGWIRKEVLGKWASLTVQAIAAVNLGIESCIQLAEFLSTAGSWQSWLIPSSVQALAKELLPQLQALRGTVNEPLQRASNEMHEFLVDVLGEHAAAVAMAVTTNVAMASAVPATRTHTGHNAADRQPRGSVPTREGSHVVGASERTDAKPGSGGFHAGVKRTLKAIGKPLTQVKGLIGEHTVDYHELARLKGNWAHDEAHGHWAPETVRKLNDKRRGDNQHKGPIHILLTDLPEVSRSGLDAVWESNGHYTVTEAKASAGMAAVYAFGKYKEKQGWIPVITGVSTSEQELHYVLSDYSDKGGVDTPLMQMSRGWVKDRAVREGLQIAARNALFANQCERRVVLVTLESQGALDHANALERVATGHVGTEIPEHNDHGIVLAWASDSIDAVEAARSAAHRAKIAAQPPAKPTKGRGG
jgi:hypothetical protein